MPLPPDPVAHLREGMIGWIQRASAETIRALLKVQRNMDSNLRKPLPPAGWKPLAQIAQEKAINPGHLARLCRELFAPQELARICTHRGRLTWFLSPEAIAQLRATHAPRDIAVSSQQSEISLTSDLRPLTSSSSEAST